MSDIDHPDFQAWLATAERVGCDESSVLHHRNFRQLYEQHPEIDPPLTRPDRGWQRLGDVAAKIVAGLIGGALPLLAAGAALYAVRALP